ncbi:kinase-like protein [Dichomitus squalens]|uniref:Kinase-like protein n=1 Tax=Dichomitus squalens TaxID=114155 RepID=A0A4Q9MBC2_9APHY|nr:kinase-like protein [Dichomitus squalens]
MRPTAATRTPDFTGLVLDGRYKLTRMLGSGAYGVVYEAIDKKSRVNRHSPSVAVKLISKTTPTHNGFSHTPLEISLHARASKFPNVVTLRRTLDDGEHSILIMDLCPGGSLGDHLVDRGAITDEQMLRTMFLDIVDAVLNLHQDGIYHRDIKPGNVLLGEDGRQVFLADFGMASRIESYNERCGTRAYMPPELLHSKYNQRPSAAHSDVWALGIVLLNMIIGIAPWSRASSSTRKYAEFVHNPRYLIERYQISPGLNKIIRRMLRANPRIRMRLADVRRAISELDSFFCNEADGGNDDLTQDMPEDGRAAACPRDDGPPDDALTGHKPTQGAHAGPSPYTNHGPSKRGETIAEMMRSTLLAEIDILRASRTKPPMLEQRAQDCSAGLSLGLSPYMSAGGRNEGLGVGGVCSRASSGQTSRSSAVVATPEDSEAVVGKREIGQRMRSIVTRVKMKFRNN